jgi:hypothetical protein
MKIRTLSSTAALLIGLASVAVAPLARSGTLSGVDAHPIGAADTCIGRQNNQMWNACSSQLHVVFSFQNSCNVSITESQATVHAWGGGNSYYQECQTVSCNNTNTYCDTSGYVATNDPVRNQDMSNAAIVNEYTNALTEECFVNPGAAIHSMDIYNPYTAFSACNAAYE